MQVAGCEEMKNMNEEMTETCRWGFFFFFFEDRKIEVELRT